MSLEQDEYVALASQCITLPTLLLVLVAKDEQLPAHEGWEQKKTPDLADSLVLENEQRIDVPLKSLSALNGNLTSFLRSKQ